MSREHRGIPQALCDDLVRNEEVLVTIEGKIGWSCQETKGGKWVGTCDALLSIIQSESLAELMEDIEETVPLLFDDLKLGELDELAKAHGWTIHRVPADDRDASREKRLVPDSTDLNESGEESFDIGVPLRYEGHRAAA